MHKSVNDIVALKKSKKKITVVTAYDYALTSICEKAGVDVLLVGDSLGMVVLGYENTAQVTMDQMCLFTEAASRARRNALLVADMPFMSYQACVTDAVANAGRLIKAGADAVKLEGGRFITDAVKSIVNMGIPVMGHIGFQPQTTTLAQGYKVQGKTKESALNLIEDAKALEEAGAFAIVLEMTAHETAGVISSIVSIPTIGIGSGVNCDGQVLVIHDILGMYEKIKPKFAKRYLSLSSDIQKAVEDYKNDVKTSEFPTKENFFSMEKGEFEKLKRDIDKDGIL